MLETQRTSEDLGQLCFIFVRLFFGKLTKEQGSAPLPPPPQTLGRLPPQ